MSDVVRVTESRELISLVKYQLGFNPSESLVVVSIKAPTGRIGLIARVNLDEVEQTAATLAGHMVTDGAARVVVIAYTDSEADARTAAATMTDHTRALLLADGGTFHVTSTTYGVLGAPHTARPVSDLESTIIAATMVHKGATAAASREDLGVKPANVNDRMKAAAAHDNYLTSTPRPDRPAGLAMWRETVAGSRATPARAGCLAAAMYDVVTRDAVLCTLLPGGNAAADALAAGEDAEGAVTRALASLIDAQQGIAPDPDLSEPARDLLTYVAAHVDSPAALTLLAVLAWWHGDGATANVHLSAALALDPQYRLARLLSDVLGVGLAPGWVRRG